MSLAACPTPADFLSVVERPGPARIDAESAFHIALCRFLAVRQSGAAPVRWQTTGERIRSNCGHLRAVRALGAGNRAGDDAAPDRQGHHRLRAVRARPAAPGPPSEGAPRDRLAGTQAKVSAMTMRSRHTMRTRSRPDARPGQAPAAPTPPAALKFAFAGARFQAVHLPDTAPLPASPLQRPTNRIHPAR